jgi:hypothetical protein
MGIRDRQAQLGGCLQSRWVTVPGNRWRQSHSGLERKDESRGGNPIKGKERGDGRGVWRQAVDWFADGKWVEVGGDWLDTLLLFNMIHNHEDSTLRDEAIDGRGQTRPVPEKRFSMDRTEICAERKAMSVRMPRSTRLDSYLGRSSRP